MKITIYQINESRDKDRICFLPYNCLEKYQGYPQINSSIYDKVFCGDVDCKDLEQIYQKFNLDHPIGYTARSLSVSDIVGVEDSPNIDTGFYFCDSFGFKKIDFEMEKSCDSAALTTSEPENSKISVVLVQPDKPPKIIEINDDLESMQAIVGGYIETYYPFTDEVCIICNEDGKCDNLPLNRAIYDNNGTLADIISGDFFIAYSPTSSENLLSMPEELANKYLQRFMYPEQFFLLDGEIFVVPYSHT